MQSDSKRKRKVEVQSIKQKYPMGQGPGWNNKKGVTGFGWDSKEGRIVWPDGTPTLSPTALADAAEALKDEQAVQVALDVFAGTQSMGPVYCQRKAVAYIPLDGNEAVFSAAQQKMVKNVPFDIMQKIPAQTMALVVRELKRRRRGVKRMRLGEVWLSPPCNTYCKLGPINGEHQFRDAGDPPRKPIKGTEKGQQAEEADDLVRQALQLIEFLASKTAEQLRTGEMMVVEGVEVDLRGME